MEEAGKVLELFPAEKPHVKNYIFPSRRPGKTLARPAGAPGRRTIDEPFAPGMHVCPRLCIPIYQLSRRRGSEVSLRGVKSVVSFDSALCCGKANVMKR